MDTRFIKLLILICALEAMTWYLLKKYLYFPNDFCFANNFCFALVVGAYMTMPFIIYQIMKTKGVALFNSIWNIISTCVTLLLGLYIFDEKITYKQKIGIIMGVIALFFMI